MASINIVQFKNSDEELRSIYNLTKNDYSEFDFKELDVIFEIALSDKSLFPNMVLSENSTARDFVSKWVKRYIDAKATPPSKKVAQPKNTCSDPAIKCIVENSGFSKDLTEESESIHNLFMSAENIQGNLLEEYISEKIRPYGWIWCVGNVMKSIDFCSVSGDFLLQVKNKSNTENSSSGAIREGTTIKKWYRLGTETRSGIKHPKYKWKELNAIINNNSVQNNKALTCNMNEDDYIKFLTQTISSNTKIINGK